MTSRPSTKLGARVHNNSAYLRELEGESSAAAWVVDTTANSPLRDGACARCWKKMRRVLMLLHFFAWEIEWAMVLMVDVILWTVLYPTSDAHDKKMHRRFPSLSQHGLNFLLMALDSACHTMIPVLHHATLLYIFGALYCIWTSIRVFLFGPLILNVVERSEVQDWYP